MIAHDSIDFVLNMLWPRAHAQLRIVLFLHLIIHDVELILTHSQHWVCTHPWIRCTCLTESVGGDKAGRCWWQYWQWLDDQSETFFSILRCSIFRFRRRWWFACQHQRDCKQRHWGTKDVRSRRCTKRERAAAGSYAAMILLQYDNLKRGFKHHWRGIHDRLEWQGLLMRRNMLLLAAILAATTREGGARGVKMASWLR